jgi:hypothetical protein
MRQSVRILSVWAFTACFAGISLLGSGWHCIFGHHFHGACASQSACSHAAHGHSHSPIKRHAKDSDAAEHSSRGLSLAAKVSTDTHDCPLCQFFGSAQWAQVFRQVELVLAAGESISAAEQTLCLTRIGSYRSRAPPSESTLS